MDKSFSLNNIICPNLSGNSIIEIAGALIEGPFTEKQFIELIFQHDTYLFVPAYPSSYGTGDVASNFRDKHNKLNNNKGCISWLNLLNYYSKINENPVYITVVDRTERLYTMNMADNGSVSIINNKTHMCDDEFTSLFDGFIKSFGIKPEHMKKIRISSKSSKFNTYFADLIGLLNMINHIINPDMFETKYLKPTLFKADSKNEEGNNLLKPVTLPSGKVWSPIEGHDYLYFEEHESLKDSIHFKVPKKGSIEKVYQQIKDLISLKENEVKKMVRDFFIVNKRYTRWSDYWVNDIDDPMCILSIINSFKYSFNTEDMDNIKLQFEEISKPWFKQLNIKK
tara:strand:+ start:585 stop:1601 length:1017 start_codon:yes stop_codon:yes gene_type:complete